MKPADGPPAGRTVTSFIQSGPASWAESDLKLLTTRGEAKPDFDNGDIKGPVSIGVAVSAPASEGTPPASRREPRAGAREARDATGRDWRLRLRGERGHELAR